MPYLPRPNAYEIAFSVRPIGQRRIGVSEQRGPALAVPRSMAAPEVLWRHPRPDGSEAHCILVRAKPINFVVWYLNDVVQGVREFEGVEEAREWTTTTLWVALPCHS